MLKLNDYDYDAVNCSPGNNFTLVPNSLLKNPEISAKSKTILSILLSNKEGWKSYQKSILKFLKEGPSALQSSLKELENYGYLWRVQYRDKKTKRRQGSFWAYTTNPFHFNIKLHLQNLNKNGLEILKNPYMENQDIGFHDMENQALIILNNNNINCNNTNDNLLSKDNKDDFSNHPNKNSSKRKRLRSRTRQSSKNNKPAKKQKIRKRYPPDVIDCMEHWNSLPMRPHKPGTKVYTRACDYIQNILDGKITSPKNAPKLSAKEIRQIFDQLSLLGNPDITGPNAAKKFRGYNLIDFLDNPYKKKSQFWDIYFKPAKNDIKNSKFIDQAFKSCTCLQKEMTEYAKTKIMSYLDKLFMLHEKIRKTPKKNDLQIDFLNRWITTESFADDYIQFIDATNGWIDPNRYPNTFDINSKVTKKFFLNFLSEAHEIKNPIKILTLR